MHYTPDVTCAMHIKTSERFIFGVIDITDMTKLQTIKVRIDNVHRNGDVFLSINDGQCYILLEKMGCQRERCIFVDENGRAYNEHNKPCCTDEQNRNTKIAILECRINSLKDELDCIRRDD